MEKEIKREARKQYVHYFRIWFIIVGVLAALCAVAGTVRVLKPVTARGNRAAGDERVFDYADVLTASQENALREYIKQCEEQYHFDIVLVTINEDVESRGNWEIVMRDYADDFYDSAGYGYDMRHGDGMLLLDNWYIENGVSQQGSWLSTCGKVYWLFGDSEINRVLDKVVAKVETDPYQAYRDGIAEACRLVGAGEDVPILPWPIIVILPAVVALIYAMVKLHQTPAENTITATSYVAGGKPVMREKRDDFIRKNVTSVRIQTSSSSGSRGGGHSGGGGGHVSSGGVSHGGGGRRR